MAVDQVVQTQVRKAVVQLIFLMYLLLVVVVDLVEMQVNKVVVLVAVHSGMVQHLVQVLQAKVLTVVLEYQTIHHTQVVVAVVAQEKQAAQTVQVRVETE